MKSREKERKIKYNYKNLINLSYFGDSLLYVVGECGRIYHIVVESEKRVVIQGVHRRI